MKLRGHGLIFSFTALLAVISSGAGYCEMLGIELVGWEDDAFLAYFEDPGFVQSSVDSIMTHFNCTSYSEVTLRVVFFKLPVGSDEEGVIDELNQMTIPGLNSAGLDHIFTWIENPDFDKSRVVDPPLEIQPDSTGLSADPDFLKQWNLAEGCLNVPPVWAETTGGGQDIIVFVLDSGLYGGHDEFASSGVEIVDYSQTHRPDNAWSEEDPGVDYFGHGTKVAGVIGAQHNGKGIMGIAPDVRLISGKVTFCYNDANDCNNSNFRIWLNAISAVADTALSNPTSRIIVTVARDMLLTAVMEKFMTELVPLMEDCVYNHNVLFVAAAGNSNSCLSTSPAYSYYPALFSSTANGYYNEQFDNIVVAVGGTTYSQEEKAQAAGGGHYYIPKAYDRTSYAAMGDTCKLVVDVSAPAGGGMVQGECSGSSELGIYVPTVGSRNSYEYAIGTSYAAPAVAGVAALTWARHPSYTAEDLKHALRSFSKTGLVIPREWDENISKDTYVMFGADWGLHMNRGFYNDYELCCPFDVIPFDPPVVWPSGTQKSAWGSPSFDTMCSPVMGSGIPDALMLGTFDATGIAYRIGGGVLTENINIDGASIVRFYGDLVIPSGVTVHVSSASFGSSGTVRFSFMDCDRQDLGVDPDRIEIIVQAGGRLEFSDDIIMAPYKLIGIDDPSPWYGIKVEPGGYFGCTSVPNSSTISLYGALKGLEIQSTLCELNDVFIDTEGEGFRAGASLSINNLTVAGEPIVGCTVEGGSFAVNNLTITGEPIVGCSVIGTGSILSATGLIDVLFNGSGAQGDAGIVLEDGAGIESISPIKISNFDIGLKCKPGAAVSVLGALDIDDCYYGLAATSTVVNITNSSTSTLTGNGGIGVSLVDASTTCNPCETIVVDGFDYGLKVNSVVGANIDIPICINNSLIHGVFVETCSGVHFVNGITVTGSSQDGVRIQGASGVVIEDSYIIDCGGSGIGVYGCSNGRVRDTYFSENAVGLFVGPDAEFDAGTASCQDWGNNTFGLASYFHVSCINQYVVIPADGNQWSGKGGTISCPPAANKILGAVSTICQ